MAVGVRYLVGAIGVVGFASTICGRLFVRALGSLSRGLGGHVVCLPAVRLLQSPFMGNSRAKIVDEEIEGSTPLLRIMDAHDRCLDSHLKCLTALVT